MLVGDANKGKTSLLLNLVKRGKMQHFSSVQRGFNGLPLATVGVDLGEYEYSPSGQPSVKFMTWDFGGQVCKSSRAQDVEVWNGFVQFGCFRREFLLLISFT